MIRAVGWYALGSALLGLLIGVSVGLSESPIVAVLVPLLFALLSGGGGFYVAKANFSKPEEKRHIAILGILLSVFSLPALIGAFYGALIRTGASIESLIPKLASQDRSNTNTNLTPDEALQIGALKLRLELLRVQPKQIEEIIARARLQINRKLSPELARSISDIKAAATDARKLFPKKQEGQGQGLSNDFDNMIRQVTEIEQSYGNLQELAAKSTHIDMKKLAQKLDTDSETISTYILFGSSVSFQAAYPDLFQSLAKLYTVMDFALSNLVDYARWISSEEFLDQVDTAIKLAKPVLPEEERERRRPSIKR